MAFGEDFGDMDMSGWSSAAAPGKAPVRVPPLKKRGPMDDPSQGGKGGGKSDDDWWSWSGKGFDGWSCGSGKGKGGWSDDWSAGSSDLGKPDMSSPEEQAIKAAVAAAEMSASAVLTVRYLSKDDSACSTLFVTGLPSPEGEAPSLLQMFMGVGVTVGELR